MLKRKRIIIPFLMIIAIFIGCNAAKTEEKIYEHIEKAVEIENDFLITREAISDLSNQEQEIYGQIFELPINEEEKINTLAEEALAIIQEKQEHLSEEKEQMNTAYEEAIRSEGFLDELKDDDIKLAAKELIDLVKNRYQIYLDLHHQMEEIALLEEELYLIYGNEAIDFDQAMNIVEEMNEKYDVINEFAKAFNQETTEFNSAKQNFYEKADLNVNYEAGKNK